MTPAIVTPFHTAYYEYTVYTWDFYTRSKVLDLGCGTGRSTIHAARKGAFVVGFDISRKMLDECKRKVNPSLLSQVCYVLGDAENLPFVDSCFDAVTCCAVLHHLPRIDECAKECSRVLQSEGKIFFAEEENAARIHANLLEVVFTSPLHGVKRLLHHLRLRIGSIVGTSIERQNHAPSVREGILPNEIIRSFRQQGVNVHLETSFFLIPPLARSPREICLKMPRPLWKFSYLAVRFSLRLDRIFRKFNSLRNRGWYISGIGKKLT